MAINKNHVQGSRASRLCTPAHVIVKPCTRVESLLSELLYYQQNTIFMHRFYAGKKEYILATLIRYNK